MITSLKKIIHLVVVLFLILTLESPKEIFADSASVLNMQGVQDTEKATCWPLDVVVVIDQSYSMFETFGDNPASDPSGYRLLGAKEVLSELILNRQEKCPEAIHRFSLITFGSQAVRHLPLVQIDLTENLDGNVWAESYFQQIDKTEADRTQNRTDFFTAFEEVMDLYKETQPPTDPESYGPRKKIIIVITDGNPTDVSRQGFSDVPDYMCSIKEELNDSDSWADFHLWVVALNAGFPYLDEEGCSSTIRQDWVDITKAHQGELFALTYNNQTIPAFVNDIVSKEFGSPGQRIACNEVFYIDPYLQRVDFLFFGRQDARNFVTISKLDNETLETLYEYKSGELLTVADETGEMTLSDYSVSNSTSKESYSFENPLTGAWRFTVEGLTSSQCQRNIEARHINYSAEVKVPQANAVLPHFDEVPYYDSASSSNFQVILRNTKTGLPVNNKSEYGMDVTVTWRLPSGKKTLPNGTAVEPVELSPDFGGIWTSSDPVLTPELGIYTYTVVGTAPNGDKSSRIEIFKVNGRYEVKDILALNFAISQPVAGGAIACNTYEKSQSINNPIPVSLQLVDRNAQPVDVARTLLSNPNESFQADLFDSTGTKLDSIFLQANDNGVFEGTLLSDKSSTVNCETMTVQIDFTGSVDPEKYSVVKTEDTIEIHRMESVGVNARFVYPQEFSKIQRFGSIYKACSPDNIMQIPVSVELTQLATGERLAPEDLLLNKDEVLYQVEVSGPDGKEIVPLNVAEDGSWYLFGMAGANVQETGEYSLKLLPNPQVFHLGYVPIDDEVKVNITRTDNWINPTSCRVVTGLSWLSAALMIAFLGFITTGGPGGRIVLTDSSGSELTSIRLSNLRLFSWFKIRNATLASAGVKYLRYWPVRSSMEGTRSVLLKAVDNNDEPIFYSELATGYPLPLTTDVSVEYVHPKISDRSAESFF